MKTRSIAICSFAVLGVACGDGSLFDATPGVNAAIQNVERAKFGLADTQASNSPSAANPLFATPPDASENADDPNAVDAASLPQCDEITSWPSQSESEERSFLSALNALRAQGAVCGDQNMPPAPPVTGDDLLACAARWHAWDMAERGYFAHDAPDGTHASDRLAAAGYSWRTWGENIAMGRATAAATLEQWAKSPPHCKNMMDPHFTQIGIGYYAKPQPQAWKGRMWVLDLGKPRPTP